MGQAAELASQHPEVKFVLDHIGCPYRRDDDGYADWLKNMKVRAVRRRRVSVARRGLWHAGSLFRTGRSMRRLSPLTLPDPFRRALDSILRSSPTSFARSLA